MNIEEKTAKATPAAHESALMGSAAAPLSEELAAAVPVEEAEDLVELAVLEVVAALEAEDEPAVDEAPAELEVSELIAA